MWPFQRSDLKKYKKPLILILTPLIASLLPICIKTNVSSIELHLEFSSITTNKHVNRLHIVHL